MYMYLLSYHHCNQICDLFNVEKKILHTKNDVNLHAPSVACGATPINGILDMNIPLLIPVVFAPIIPATCVPIQIIKGKIRLLMSAKLPCDPYEQLSIGSLSGIAVQLDTPY